MPLQALKRIRCRIGVDFAIKASIPWPCPLRLVAQDIGFSVREQGFDSPRGYFSDLGRNRVVFVCFRYAAASADKHDKLELAGDITSGGRSAARGA